MSIGHPPEAEKLDGLLNAPFFLPIIVNTALEVGSATAMSLTPSPLKSPVTMPRSVAPTGRATGDAKLPSGEPKSTVTTGRVILLTATSSMPSPLKSAAAIYAGPAATKDWGPAIKVTCARELWENSRQATTNDVAQ
jgi:hypothetical protein